MRLIYAALFTVLSLVLTGCVDVRYIGDVYPPTENVRFFMNEKDIPINTYREMGLAIASIDEEDAALHSGNVLSDALREKAKEVGADAILIESSERYKVGTRHSSSSDTFYTERHRSKTKERHDKHHSRERHKSKTYGHADTYTSGTSYDIQRDEVRAKFLKLKSADVYAPAAQKPQSAGSTEASN